MVTELKDLVRNTDWKQKKYALVVAEGWFYHS